MEISTVFCGSQNFGMPWDWTFLADRIDFPDTFRRSEAWAWVVPEISVC